MQHKFKVGDKVLVIKKEVNELKTPWSRLSDSWWNEDRYPSTIGKVVEIKKCGYCGGNIAYHIPNITNWFPEDVFVYLCDIEEYRGKDE